MKWCYFTDYGDMMTEFQVSEALDEYGMSDLDVLEISIGGVKS